MCGLLQQYTSLPYTYLENCWEIIIEFLFKIQFNSINACTCTYAFDSCFLEFCDKINFFDSYLEISHLQCNCHLFIYIV